MLYPISHRALILAVCGATHAAAQFITTLSPDTKAAFDRYVASVEPSILEQLRRNAPVPLMGQDVPGRLRAGEVALQRISKENGTSVPKGLIHDWAGGIFIRAGTVDQLAAVLQDFDRHKEWYPEVIASKLHTRNGTAVSGSWILRKKKIITVVARAHLDTVYHRTSATHGYLLSNSGPFIEIQDYSTPQQTDYPPSRGHGFLWAFKAYWSLFRDDTGLYAGCRIISLSRDVPAVLSWVVGPLVREIPRESIESTLKNTREAVLSLK